MRFGLSFLLLLPFAASAELSSIADDDLANVSGQGGVYLSGDITINELGGPIENEYWGKCGDAGKHCGGRLSYKLRENGGWFVLDDLRGSFSFQGLTIRTRTINSGFAGDGAQFNRDVLEIGLPDFIQYDNVGFTLAASNRGRPTNDAGQIYSDFKQNNFFGVEVGGKVEIQGNLLVFPTGNR